jgi:hypothetical protein
LKARDTREASSVDDREAEAPRRANREVIDMIGEVDKKERNGIERFRVLQRWIDVLRRQCVVTDPAM